MTDPHAARLHEDGPGVEDPLGFLLRRSTPEDVLSALESGDPLRIYERTRKLLRANCLLLDLDRLFERTCLRVAVLRPSIDEGTNLDELLTTCGKLAIRDLMLEDLREGAEGNVELEEWDPRYGFLTDLIGIDPVKARKACVDFNCQPLENRKAFFLCCMEGLNVPQIMGRADCDKATLRIRCLRAFEALLDRELVNSIDAILKRQRSQGDA